MKNNLLVRKGFGDVQYLQMPVEVDGTSTLVYIHAVSMSDLLIVLKVY